MQIRLKFLSQREQEILRLVATGASNKEIARQLAISKNTVKVHLRNIFEKLEVNSRTEAAMVAVNTGLIPRLPEQIESVEMPGLELGDINKTILKAQLTKPAFGPSPTLMHTIIIFIVVSVLTVTSILVYKYWISEPKEVSTNHTANPWNSLTPMPTARFGFATVVYDNHIFAMGGEDGQIVSRVVEKYDPERNQWFYLGLMPQALADIQAAEIGGRFYIPGGRLASGEISADLQIYNPSLNKWSKGKSLPIPISSYALEEYEGSIWVFGGKNREGFLSTVLVYDPELDSWKYKTPMQSPRAFLRAEAVGNKIYLLGGYDGKEPLDIMEVYQPGMDDGLLNPWSKVDRMPDKRYSMGIVSMLEVIYMVGGKGNGDGLLPMQRYLTRTGEWQTIQKTGDQKWSDMAIEALGNDIYAIGGNINSEPSSGLYSMQVVFISVLPFVP